MSFRKIICVWGFVGLGFSAAHAADPEPADPVQPVSAAASTSSFPSFVIALSGGPAWAEGGNTQTLVMGGGVQRTYSAAQSPGVIADGELFVGLRNPLFYIFDAQLGIAAAMTSNVTLTGTISDANSSVNNYVYSYQLRHSHLAVKGRLLLDVGLSFSPFINGSVGLGFNDSTLFTNTPTVSGTVAQPNFADNSVVAFTYTVAIGVEYLILKQLRVGAAYELTDWGASALAAAPGQSVGGGLTLDHLYAHGLTFSISVQI
jgi:opacity protein-like surface antigen